jgi:integrase
LRKKLTEVFVKNAKPPREGRLYVTDADLPCLTFVVTAKGARSWVIRARVKGSSSKRVVEVPGSYPAVSLAAARNRAREIVSAAKRGIELPEQERRQAAQRVSAEAAATPSSVANVATDYVKRVLEDKQRAASYVSATRSMLDRYVIPAWGARDIRSITPREPPALLDDVIDAGKPVMANRLHRALSGMFKFALRRGLIESSPMALVDRPAGEKARERVLSAGELQLLWPEFKKLGYPFGPYLMLLLVLGQRRNEVAQMRWTDIDEVERTWTIPKTKKRPFHVVPLSPLALALLAEIKGAQTLLFQGRSITPVYVFTTTGTKPVSGHSRAKERADKAATAVRQKKHQPALERWTLHDLRRTCSTNLGRLKVPRFIIERVLNHADASVTGIYDRYEYLAEKRDALERWSAYLTNLVETDRSNVVNLRG